MRTLWIVLLALLLPLRLMASDAMAVHMMTGNATPHAEVMAAPADTDMAMHADCPGHSGVEVTQDATAADQNSHCPTCSHCQACSAVAMGMHGGTAPMALAPNPPPAMPALSFSSAELSPGHKPPIS